MDREDAPGIEEDEQSEDACRKDTPGPLPHNQYTRAELLDLRECEISRKRPSCLDRAFDTADGLWDPEKWFRAFSGGSRENSPLTVGDGRDRDRRRPLDDMLGRNRKTSTSDPKERLKEEQDGIVLSPQRRNFSTGCQVSKTSSVAVAGGSTTIYRQSSLTDYKDRDDRERERRDTRRIGSGRIRIEQDQGRDREQEYHRYSREDRDRDRDRDRRDRDQERERLDRDRVEQERERLERDRERRGFAERAERDRGFRRGKDVADKMAEHRDGIRDRVYRDRYREERRFERGGRRRYPHEEETPEWFTGGPTSRNETIELRGFENKTSEKRRRQQDEEDEQEMVHGEEDDVGEYAAEEDSQSDAVNETGDAKESTNGEQDNTEEAGHYVAPKGADQSRPPHQSTPTSMFDFNHFFNIEHIPGLMDVLHDPHEVETNESGSRFSKWFAAQAMAASAGQGGHDRDANINNNLIFNHRSSPANINLVEVKSPAGMSPPPNIAAHLFNDRHMYHSFPINRDSLTYSPDHQAQQKGLPAVVSALFQNSSRDKSGNATPSSRGSFSTQDAEAQLKALLFGSNRDSASSSGTASPANVPPGVQRKMKTVAELEADMHQSAPPSPASTPHSTPAPVFSCTPPTATARTDDGDQSAFNRLLNMMKASGNQHALLRNREQQRQIQQQTLQAQAQAHAQAQAQAKAQAHAHQIQQHLQQQAGLQAQGVLSKVPVFQHLGQQQGQQQPHLVAPRPVLPQSMGRMSQGQPRDSVLNFLQQNPTIIMKPASPISSSTVAGHNSAHGPGPSPLPPGLPPPSIRVTSVTSQRVNNPLTANNPLTGRVPSPIMFSQQPPMHLNAPSPIHPVQLGPMTGQALSSNTLTTTSGMRSPVLQRVPSPQELVAHTQAILQTALIKRKLEDQKERYLKKQQERDKSPLLQAANVANRMNSPSVTSSTPSQPKPPMTFTPTSVIRKMHSDRVTEKEKQAKENDDDMLENHKHSLEKQSSDSFEDSALGGSGEIGVDHSDMHLSRNSFSSNISALSGQLEEGLHLAHHEELSYPPPSHDNMDEKMFYGMQYLTNFKGMSMIRQLVGQPIAPPPTSAPGRPIVKGSADTPPASMGPQIQMPPPPLQSHPLPRPLTGGAIPLVKSEGEPRPIMGASSNFGGIDLAKLLEQQRFHHHQAVLPPHPLAPRAIGAGPAPPPPFMPITPGMPIQPVSASQASVQNAMIMQFNRVNAMNHINQLAALQHQQRLMDPRLQPLRAIIPAVSHSGPISPRSSLPSGVPVLAPPINTGVPDLKRSYSPAHPIFSQASKPVMNGPFPMGAPVSSAPSDGEIFKWFRPEVLKTQLPSMPPLPTHGNKVMTVDEIERS